MIIEKRYQYFCGGGKVWTRWFNLKEGNKEDLQRLNKDDKFQLKGKLLNEYRLKEN